MAYISTEPHSVFATLGAALRTVGTVLADFTHDLWTAKARATEIETLQSLSDEDLGQHHGITRADILNYVFDSRMVP